MGTKREFVFLKDAVAERKQPEPHPDKGGKFPFGELELDRETGEQCPG